MMLNILNWAGIDNSQRISPQKPKNIKLSNPLISENTPPLTQDVFQPSAATNRNGSLAELNVLVSQKKVPSSPEIIWRALKEFSELPETIELGAMNDYELLMSFVDNSLPVNPRQQKGLKQILDNALSQYANLDELGKVIQHTQLPFPAELTLHLDRETIPKQVPLPIKVLNRFLISSATPSP